MRMLHLLSVYGYADERQSITKLEQIADQLTKIGAKIKEAKDSVHAFAQSWRYAMWSVV